MLGALVGLLVSYILIANLMCSMFGEAGMVIAIFVMVGMLYLIAQENTKKINDWQEKQRKLDEENARICNESRLERNAKYLFFDDPLKPYNSITVELNYLALTESEEDSGYIPPSSPNYSKKNKEEYDKKLSDLKWREDWENTAWLRKLK